MEKKSLRFDLRRVLDGPFVQVRNSKERQLRTPKDREGPKERQLRCLRNEVR